MLRLSPLLQFEVTDNMARKKSRRQNRDWRLTVFIIISLVIVLTMILAYLPGFLGGPS